MFKFFVSYLKVGLILFSSTLFTLQAAEQTTADSEQTIISLSLKGSFNDIFDATVSSILSKSLTIAHVDNAAQALANSHQEYGLTTAQYSNAKIISFCSANLSHQLSLENPDFIVLCPFKLSVYQLSEKPNEVTISYRNPLSTQINSPALAKLALLYQRIIEDATVWFVRLPTE